MRVVIAPDSFSGTLDAVAAAEAIAEGWRRARPGDEVRLAPMSDGGEGLLSAVAHARPDAVVHHVEVADARGIATTARWLLLDDGVAVVETAEAVGLHRLPEDRRDPLQATSYGVGQLLRAVAEASPSRVVIGLGGSATVDGGAGMLSALTGHALRRADGNGVRVGGRWVRDAHTITSHELPAMPEEVVIAADVTSPLLGPHGAARVFGPQKGATPAAVEELEAGLAHLADVVEAQLPGGPWRDVPGAGAAGGLGFMLMALLGGRITSGAEAVADLLRLDLAQADLVITGEGRVDAQTGTGKAPHVVAQLARDAGARTAVIAGELADGAEEGFDLAAALGPEGLRDPAGRLAEVAEAVASGVRP